MARFFDSASSEYLYNNNAVVSGYPFAVVFRFRPTTLAVKAMFSISHSSTVGQWFAMMYTQSDLRLAVQSRNGGTSNTANSTTSGTQNVWNHAAGIYAATDDRRSILDGGGKGTNTGGVALQTVNKTGIGAVVDGGTAYYYDGDLAEVAVYNLSVWPGEAASDKANNFEKIIPSLAAGFSPKMFPLGLVAYWPLIRGLNDRVGGYDLTASGTVVSAHCPVLMPSPQRVPGRERGLSIAVMMQHYKKMRVA